MPRVARSTTLIALVIATVLAGCGGGGGDKKPATQVAAKVNKEEVSVHQVNGMLMRAGNIPADQAKDAGVAALESLIEQELLVQKAVDRKLDRDPKVMQSLDAARREILARAYLEQVMSQVTRPSDSEVSSFYSENPALFAQRRIYSMQEVAIGMPAERYGELEQKVRELANLQKVAVWLNEQKIPFNINQVVKPAEQLPMEKLKNFAELKDGQIALTTTPGGAALLQLVGSRMQPLDQATARPFIEQYLSTSKRAEVAQAEIKHLRDTAAIEYVGDFAKTAPSAKPGSAPAAATPPLPSPAATADTMRATLEKGAAGLR